MHNVYSPRETTRDAVERVVSRYFNPGDARACHAARARRVERASPMFSRENRKFLIVFCTITIVAISTIVGAVYLIQHDKQAAAVWTGGGVLITYFLGFVRAELRARDAATDRQAIGVKLDQATEKVQEIEKKTNGNLSRAIQDVGEEVRKAKEEPAPGQEVMPRTPKELQSLLKIFAHSICDDMAHKAALRAARAMAERTDSAIKSAGDDAARCAGEVAARRVIDELKRAGIIKDPVQ